MADYAAVAPTSAGAVVVERTGAASGDTVPAGSLVLVRNTGAGSHTWTETIGYTFDGLTVGTSGTRVITLAAGEVQAIRVPHNYGNSDGLVPIAINGTATEVKYSVLGA